MTHGFKNGRVIAELGTVESDGPGEMIKYQYGTTADHLQYFASNGTPEGVHVADKGSTASDYSTGDQYYKTTDGVNTGWVKVGASSSVGGSGITFLASATASASASVEFTSFIDSTYNVYLIVIEDWSPSAASGMYIRTSTDGGVTFDSTASDYAYNRITSGNNTATQIEIGSFGASGDTASGWCMLMNPSAATSTKVLFHCDRENTGNAAAYIGTGHRKADEDVDAIQFFQSTGTITSGNFYLYGLVTPS